MASMIGGLAGFVFGAALFGALISWLLRKVSTVAVVPSYAIGVTISTAVYMLLTERLYTDFGSTAAGVLAGVLAGLTAFGLLCLTSRRAKEERPS
jgi:hypothetical protein